FEYRNVNNNDRAGKKEYIKFLKANKNRQYDCKSNYEILSQDGKVCIAKATMVFDNFTRVDYITLNQGKDGWKVSKVETTYPEETYDCCCNRRHVVRYLPMFSLVSTACIYRL